MMTRARSLFIAGISSVCLSSAAAAQDRPVVFMHGFGAEASDWNATADRLRNLATIEPHIPELPWRSTYEEQARDLQARPELFTLPGSTVAVGHSNGGIVAREWSKRHRFDGIVTIGTPHRGAPIIQHLFDWSTFSAIAPGLLNDVLDS